MTFFFQQQFPFCSLSWTESRRLKYCIWIVIFTFSGHVVSFFCLRYCIVSYLHKNLDSTCQICLKPNFCMHACWFKYNVSSNTGFAQIQCWSKYNVCSNASLAQIQCWSKYNLSSNASLAQIQDWLKYNVGSNIMLVQIQC